MWHVETGEDEESNEERDVLEIVLVSSLVTVEVFRLVAVHAGVLHTKPLPRSEDKKYFTMINMK